MPITANGTYLLKPAEEASGATSVVYISGALGAATATISYFDRSGTLVPFSSGVVAVNDQYKVEHGSGVELYLVVTGADGATAIEHLTTRL